MQICVMMAGTAAAVEVVRSAASGVSYDHKRDTYGFVVRPHHLQRYREYANIYKEEEEERSDRWKFLLERHCKFAELSNSSTTCAESTKQIAVQYSKDKRAPVTETELNQVPTWREIRPSLQVVEDMMSSRVKKKSKFTKNELDSGVKNQVPPVVEAGPGIGISKEDSDEEFYDLEKSESDSEQEVISTDGTLSSADHASDLEGLPLWKEIECLVQGGLPMALRGELWRAFVGVRAHRLEEYYYNLITPDTKVETKGDELEEKNEEAKLESTGVPENWKIQIEKDIPGTFPRHPALDENARNALRRVLTAYARHNPAVGYFQGMNLFAGLLLLMMPEENAFWTLVCILDDYFDGYFSGEMIEAQVDQLVLEELVRERFPKLAFHLEYLGVQMAWVTGPWFLSIFMNVLPWESVLRVWDVLLFEGNRVMLFWTILALLDLYGPALGTTKDAGDAVQLLQSLADSTFDSSQLVLTACMGFQNVKETELQELRNKHRPAVRAILKETSRAVGDWKDTQSLASKLYIFKKDPVSIMIRIAKWEHDEKEPSVKDDILRTSPDVEIDPGKDTEEQLVWLTAEMCKVLMDRRSAALRVEELDIALMEMVKQDNRRQLSARVEHLDREVAELVQAITDKKEQEKVMTQILMRVEQEQNVTEDARICAEQDAAAQRYAVQVIQEKYEEAAAALGEMEKRAVVAESMLEATMQSQLAEFHPPQPTQAIPKGMLGSPFRWRERNKQQQPSQSKEPNDKKPSNGH